MPLSATTRTTTTTTTNSQECHSTPRSGPTGARSLDSQGAQSTSMKGMPFGRRQSNGPHPSKESFTRNSESEPSDQSDSHLRQMRTSTQPDTAQYRGQPILCRESLSGQRDPNHAASLDNSPLYPYPQRDYHFSLPPNRKSVLSFTQVKPTITTHHRSQQSWSDSDNDSISSRSSWSDEESNGRVRMARRESITSTIATTRILPAPSTPRNIVRATTGTGRYTVNQANLEKRIQDLRQSLTRRIQRSEDEGDEGKEEDEGEKEKEKVPILQQSRQRGQVTLGPSVTKDDFIQTYPVSTVSSRQDIRARDIRGIGSDKRIDDRENDSTSDNVDKEGHDLQTVRDEIREMLEALERSKASLCKNEKRVDCAEALQVQQWLMERSERKARLQEDCLMTRTEAPKRTPYRPQQESRQQNRYHDTQTSTSPRLQDAGTDYRFARRLSERASSQNDNGSFNDDSGSDSISDNSTPRPKYYFKKHGRTRHSQDHASSEELNQQSFSSSSGLSEYRDPNNPQNPIARPTTIAKVDAGPTTLKDGTGVNDIRTNERGGEAQRTSIVYQGRDYVSGQRGFYTFMNDGFGTESLVYCHDLVHYPAKGEEDASWKSLVLRHILDSLDRMHVQLERLSTVLCSFHNQTLGPFLEHARQWTYRHGHGNNNKDDDPLDWLYSPPA
ncbi:hypothetical protein BGZ94_006300, partial [Podila epigama]